MAGPILPGGGSNKSSMEKLLEQLTPILKQIMKPKPGVNLPSKQKSLWDIFRDLFS